MIILHDTHSMLSVLVVATMSINRSISFVPTVNRHMSSTRLFSSDVYSKVRMEETDVYSKVSMEEIVSLCKRRGFIFGSSEIYNGMAGFYDYGPLGTELKKNVKDLWWREFVTRRE